MSAVLLLLLQAPPPSSLADAYAKLQAHDAKSAIAILEPLVAADRTNARAWRVLASAYYAEKTYEKAIAAGKASLDVDPSNATMLYSIGIYYALFGRKDDAFAWLGRARATRRFDMTQLTADDDAASLAGDPRFKALLPSPDDFTAPFVEETKVLREWDGESAGDQFGWIARDAGDVDGDGVHDVVTSAPTSGAGGPSAGRVYVYSTKTGALVWKADGHAKDQLGIGIEAAGDTNRDGIPDVIASAPGAGKAYVYSGRDGRVLLTLTAEHADDAFGRHVDGVGDVNGDGYADLFVGAPNNSANGKGAGRAYIYSGKEGRVLLTLTGERAGDGFGSAVAGRTDHGHVTLVVGAPKGGPRRTGRIYVYRALSTSPSFTFDSDDTGRALGGMFVSVPGDEDGDGIADVYASDWQNAAQGPGTGRVYVYSGRDGHRLFAWTGATQGEGFGTSPSTAGDVDGDGTPDFIVGAWQFGGAAVGAGKAYLYSGHSGALLKAFTCRTPGDAFGFDAVGLGDVDGDGTTDLLVTSGWSGIHGFHSGRVFVISSGVRR